jgi:hypothetical protein
MPLETGNKNNVTYRPIDQQIEKELRALKLRARDNKIIALLAAIIGFSITPVCMIGGFFELMAFFARNVTAAPNISALLSGLTICTICPAAAYFIVKKPFEALDKDYQDLRLVSGNIRLWNMRNKGLSVAHLKSVRRQMERRMEGFDAQLRQEEYDSGFGIRKKPRRKYIRFSRELMLPDFAFIEFVSPQVTAPTEQLKAKAEKLKYLADLSPVERIKKRRIMDKIAAAERNIGRKKILAAKQLERA